MCLFWNRFECSFGASKIYEPTPLAYVASAPGFTGGKGGGSSRVGVAAGRDQKGIRDGGIVKKCSIIKRDVVADFEISLVSAANSGFVNRKMHF